MRTRLSGSRVSRGPVRPAAACSITYSPARLASATALGETGRVTNAESAAPAASAFASISRRRESPARCDDENRVGPGEEGRFGESRVTGLGVGHDQPSRRAPARCEPSARCGESAARIAARGAGHGAADVGPVEKGVAGWPPELDDVDAGVGVEVQKVDRKPAGPRGGNRRRATATRSTGPRSCPSVAAWKATRGIRPRDPARIEARSAGSRAPLRPNGACGKTRCIGRTLRSSWKSVARTALRRREGRRSRRGAPLGRVRRGEQGQGRQGVKQDRSVAFSFRARERGGPTPIAGRTTPPEAFAGGKCI